MTEHEPAHVEGTDDQSTNHEEKELTIFDQPEGTDWFLSYLIGFADDLGSELGITLVVGGTYLTGTLISGRTYFEELGAMMKKIGGQGTDNGLTSLGEQYEQFATLVPKLAENEEWKPRPRAYIHLRNVKMLISENKFAPTTEAVLWRGKLSAVEGFIVGTMSIDPSL